jgi:Flp pilus assembly protein TadG
MWSLTSPWLRRLARAVRRRARLASMGEEGSAAVEVAVLAPLLVLVVFAGVQLAQWYFARTGAYEAAVAGAQAGRLHQAAADAADSAARSYLLGLGGSVGSPSVQVSTSAEDVTVTVSGQAPLILALPGLSLTVEQSATAPMERWVTP